MPLPSRTRSTCNSISTFSFPRMKRNARLNYLICIYLLGMVFFTLFRLAETVAYCATTEGPDDFGGLYGKALWIGVRFDAAVSGFVTLVPLVLLIVAEMADIRKRWYHAMVHYLLMVLYTVCFFACAADIPYFCYFFSRLDAMALAWSDSPDTMAATPNMSPTCWHLWQ